jgi:hypothetical protein
VKQQRAVDVVAQAADRDLRGPLDPGSRVATVTDQQHQDERVRLYPRQRAFAVGACERWVPLTHALEPQ